MQTFCSRREIVNPNVPDNARIVAHWHTMSGEIGHTIYADPGNNLWYVSDWCKDKPVPCSLSRVQRETGLTPAEVDRWVGAPYPYQSSTM